MKALIGTFILGVSALTFAAENRITITPGSFAEVSANVDTKVTCEGKSTTGIICYCRYVATGGYNYEPVARFSEKETVSVGGAKYKDDCEAHLKTVPLCSK